MNTQIFIGLGSNLGDRIENLKTASEKISNEIGQIVKISSLYQSKALGFTSDSDFINQVIEIKSELNAFQILKITQEIERQMGRTKKSINKSYSDRIIDIDILYYNQEIFENEELCLPHKEMYHRNFVLVPLAEIARNFIDPKTKFSVEKLVELSEDKIEVVKY